MKRSMVRAFLLNERQASSRVRWGDKPGLMCLVHICTYLEWCVAGSKTRTTRFVQDAVIVKNLLLKGALSEGSDRFLSARQRYQGPPESLAVCSVSAARETEGKKSSVAAACVCSRSANHVDFPFRGDDSSPQIIAFLNCSLQQTLRFRPYQLPIRASSNSKTPVSKTGLILFFKQPV